MNTKDKWRQELRKMFWEAEGQFMSDIEDFIEKLLSSREKEISDKIKKLAGTYNLPIDTEYLLKELKIIKK